MRDPDRKFGGLTEKNPTPDSVKPAIEKAKRRTLRRDVAPFMELVRSPDGDAEWNWPFDDSDGTEWKFLILDAFGTRHGNIATVFVNQLMALCSRDWDATSENWYPDDVELTSLLAIIASFKPRNEAQAAMAAQMAAVHLMSMRVAKRVGENPWDSRLMGAFAKLTRTYAAQMEVMHGINGKRRSTQQKITVRHEKHIHHHQHVHLEGGAKENESQPHATVDGRAAENEPGPEMLGEDAGGQIVPLRSCEGQAGLPHARRGKRIGRAHG
jgi:hypothetical protein